MRSSYSVLCCCAALALSACMGYPDPIARGYSSYDQAYKSAPGPKGHNIGYEYSYQNNKAVLEDIHHAARDLVEKLDAKLSMGIDEIYLKTPENNVFYNSFDYALREEFIKQGYKLSNTPVNTMIVDFMVLPECTVAETREEAYQMLYLSLVVNVVEGIPQDYVGDYYDVPSYGLGDLITKNKDEEVKVSLCPGDGQIIDLAAAIEAQESKGQAPQALNMHEGQDVAVPESGLQSEQKPIPQESQIRAEDLPEPLLHGDISEVVTNLLTPEPPSERPKVSVEPSEQE